MRLYTDRPSWIAAALAAGIIGFVITRATASGLVEIQPLTDHIVMLHFNDGHVQHHQRGQPRSDEKVIVDPLDVEAAARAASYAVTSPDDPAYREAKAPSSVSRKSKGTDFAWFVDKWENGRAVNTRPDHTKEHWLYLGLPTAMQPGRTYTVNTGPLAKNGREWTLQFDTARARSEAVHVNTLGYVPDTPQKHAYVYHWMGDGGPLDLKPYEGRPFHLVEMGSGSTVFSGQVRFRMGKENQETARVSENVTADVVPCTLLQA